MKGVGRYAYQLLDALSERLPIDSRLYAVAFKGIQTAIAFPSNCQVFEVSKTSELRLGMIEIRSLLEAYRSTYSFALRTRLVDASPRKRDGMS